MIGSEWYGYIYPKNIEIMTSKKILVPLDIARCASFAFDEGGQYAFTSGYGITLKESCPFSWHYLLGVLNSRLPDIYLKNISTTMRGGFFRYFTQFIEKLPIPSLAMSSGSDRIRQDRMTELVRTRLALGHLLIAIRTPSEKANVQHQIDFTDRQIDKLVYELYELTEEEIAIVEEATR